MGNVIRNGLPWLKGRFDHGWKTKIGHIDIILDVSWLLITPVSAWAIAAVYVPIMGTGLSGFQAWVVSIVILALMFLSLFLHYLAHIALTRVGGNNLPDRLFAAPLGDPAQSWPPARNAGKEALSALAGPLANFLLAVLFYFLWNLQINKFFNAITFFLVFSNLGLAAINLIPAFPFDGGRLMRAVIWWLLERPGLATRLALRLGWGISAGLVGWGIFLIVQQRRFSLETAAATFIYCALTIFSLALRKGQKWEQTERPIRTGFPSMVIRSCLAVLLILPLAAVTFSLIPLNDGLEAPGFTASVEPMVQLPAEYRHAATGSLILLTVIPQTPILAGEWVYAHLDHSIRLVPQDEIVPPNQTAQSVARGDYQMLLDSKTTAVIVGLRLAGYTVDIKNDGVDVISVLTDSPAVGTLLPGDVITGMNGNPVISPEDLTGPLKLLAPGTILDLEILRDGQIMEISVPAMEPLEAGGSVRIGISIGQHTGGFSLPFPVEIVPQKVDGGPSAGLMFTLGVYDLVTGQDITGGRIIAGTGTIDLEGNVGPIGGVRQKVVAAERAGAEYFLSPAENYADALAMARKIKVVEITTARDAIDFLRSLPPVKTR